MQNNACQGPPICYYGGVMMRNPLIFFAEEAKRRGYTIKVVGDYCFKKSRRIDSPRIRFTKTIPEGITVTEYHPRTKKSKEINVKESRGA
jgi:hypothetical protein